MLKNSLLFLLLSSPLLAYEPQFVIGDSLIDQNFKNIAAELKDTKNDVSNAVPVGTIIDFISISTPTGFLYCNGQSVSTTTYAALHALIGYTFGGSAGSFTIPDLRGMFMRGLDDGRGLDDETRVVGSTETDKFQGHYHQAYDQGHSFLASGGVAYGSNASVDASTNLWKTKEAITDGTNGTPRTGNETRPKNMAVAKFIKY